MTFSYTAQGQSCRILLENGALRQVGAELSALAPASRAMIVSDRTVAPLYLQQVQASLQSAGIAAEHFLLPAGEAAKTLEHYAKLLQALADAALCRNDTILALGGGCVGDLAGFAAATYLRGVRFAQIPTTLLSMVDACIGGKCAVDLPQGKNLVGAFHQPALVVCDPNLLDSLPQPLFCEGCAEIIKTAVLFDEALFAHLEEKGLNFDRPWVIGRCLRHKARLVEEDPFDLGARRLLNLGHTLGHAVETLSGFSELHGNAVSIGLAAMSRAFCKDAARICALLERFRLPIHTNYPARELARAALRDKKSHGAEITLVVPRAIGNCELLRVPLSELEAIWREVI